MNNLITTNTQDQIKITSLDIAEMTGKRHDHVMRDITQEIESLGEVDGLPIFGESSYTNSQNKKLPCYTFGKAGAMQIALRYDAKTRFKVVRRIEELERGGATPKPAAINHEVAEAFDATLTVATLLGLKGNQAKLSTNTAVKKAFGLDCMATLGVTGLIAEEQKQFLTPSVLGKKLGISAQKFNKALESAGMHAATRDHKNRIVWIVTDTGKNYCQLIDTNKQHSDGAPIHQVKWSEDVVDAVPELAAKQKQKEI